MPYGCQRAADLEHGREILQLQLELGRLDPTDALDAKRIEVL